jgi:hypothetical protein
MDSDRVSAQVPLVYWDSGLSGFPQHYLRVDDLLIMEVIQSLLLCSLCIYISDGRIRYCLVVYIVPCLRDHLCRGTQFGNCTDPSEAFPMMYGSRRS